LTIWRPNRYFSRAILDHKELDATVTLLEVRDLQVSFDVRGGRELLAVQGISFDLEAGERVGLVGESGCGKSTALLALMGLLPPSATVGGEVRIDGVDILAGGEESVRPSRWTNIAMVFQGAMNALNPVKTVGWQIVEPMILHGMARGQEAWRKAEHLLTLVGIPAEAAKRYPHEFSGGMRQRAAIAMALACDPRVLLADEPTTALDVMVQAQILDLLSRLTDELGLALILVTHDLPVVAQVCERAAVMYAGRFVETGSMDDLYHDPHHPYTRMLFGATPDLRRRELVTSIPGSPPRLDRDIVGCPFQPRCDQAADRCAAEAPGLLQISTDRAAACHLGNSALVGGKS
jgi:peptide/nickel transport system ATP-binding protein